MAEKSNKTEKSEKKDKSTTQKKPWFKSLKAEFAKITWPDRKRITKETVVVVVSGIVLGAITFAIDLLLELGLSFLW